jgi:hypothetical protein
MLLDGMLLGGEADCKPCLPLRMGSQELSK